MITTTLKFHFDADPSPANLAAAEKLFRELASNDILAGAIEDAFGHFDFEEPSTAEFDSPNIEYAGTEVTE